jgi:hypothetical protein
LKFLVYKDGQLRKDFVLSGAYLFGADLIPFRHVDGITFSDGVIDCAKKSQDSAGLSLLWPVEGFGRLMLSTARIPERQEPYILNIELARARLMQITLKREDWALFDQSDTLEAQAEEAQDLFIKALQNICEPEKASVLADQALAKGLEFSETLAARHAEQYLALRFKNRGLGRHSLGCAVDPSLLDNEKYLKWLLEMFGFITLPTNWGRIEKKRGEYNFDELDHCMDHLSGKRLALCAGPLLCFSPDKVPGWLLKEEKAFEKIRERAYEFITKIVTRYGKHIHAWRVISGMNAANCFGFTFEQSLEMTRTACLAAKSADSKSRKIVEILCPWGEYYAFDKTTVPPLVYADMVIQSGISFDAFGLQFHFGKDEPGMHVRDMMQISSRLDCFASVPKAIHITGISVPDRPGTGTTDPQQAGIWRKDWDPAVQAEWLENFYKVSLGRPFINTVTYSHLADSAEMPAAGCGLLSEKFSPKQAFLVVAKFQKAILKHLK